MELEGELKVAVTSVIEKHPNADYLAVYNALQGVSYSILVELEDQRTLKEREGLNE